MAKQLDEKSVLNELHGESAFFQSSPPPVREPSSRRVMAAKKKPKPVKQAATKAGVQPQGDMPEKQPSQPVDRTVDPLSDAPQRQPRDVANSQPINQPEQPSVDQGANQPGNELTAHAFDMSPVLPRPKAFYITEVQDEALDLLVKKLAARVKGQVEQKIDRSVATRLIYESMDLTHDDTVTRLADLLIRRLTSQLTRPPLD